MKRGWRPRGVTLGAIAGLLVIVLASGCGGSGGKPQLTVSAAASLRLGFATYARDYSAAQIHYSFAGSDALAAQIEQGARPDVFAAANEKLPAMLYARHLVERPVTFATNSLVIAVPSSSRIAGLAGLLRRGVSIAVGTASVPVGSYSQAVLERMAPLDRRRFVANIRDREPDVTGIVGKLVEGAVDAGLLYATDVGAAAGRLRAISLPAALRPQVAYAAAVVRGSSHAVQARAFVAGLLRGAGREALQRAGFAAPP